MSSNIDDLLVKFNLFGKYYMKCSVLIFFLSVFDGFIGNNYVFAAVRVDYRCADECFGNNTCAASSINATKACTKWVYDDPNSFMAEFQLACQDWKVELVGTVHHFGFMFGLLLSGPLSDRIGRKRTMVIACFFAGVLGIAKSFANSYWMYVILEFLEALLGDFNSPTFTYSMEIVDHKKRLPFQLISGQGYALSFALFAIIAWLVPYWRYMLRVIYMPLILLTSCLFFIDESPRWLLSKGDKEEAIKIIEKMAKTNNVIPDKDALNTLSHEDVKGVKFVKLLRDTFASKLLLKTFFICLTWWIASTFVNYGMQINSVSLQGNKYVNFALISITEVLSLIVVVYLLIRFRRKLPLAWSFFLSSLFCASVCFIPKNLPWLSVILYMVGKFMSAIFFTITYVYTAELFPTQTRNTLHSLCSSIGRIGSIIAPQTPLLMIYWKGLPSMVFAAVSLVAGLITLCALDTANNSLPDTVRQVEALEDKIPKKATAKKEHRKQEACF